MMSRALHTILICLRFAIFLGGRRFWIHCFPCPEEDAPNLVILFFIANSRWAVAKLWSELRGNISIGGACRRSWSL